jgi:hypothetical protein
LGTLITASVVLTLVGPVGPASAAEEGPGDVEALEVVPGLADAATEDSSSQLLESSLGVTVVGASGSSTVLERVSDLDVQVAHSDDGETVLESTSVDTDTVIQQLSDGARLIEIIGSDEAPQEFVYELDVPAGMSLLPQEDGSLLIGMESRVADTVAFEVDGVVGAPWAVDADGESVPASYDVGDDGEITMRVEHSEDVAYPVVADPTFTKGGFRVVYNVWTPWAVTVYLNKARTADAEDLGAGICIAIAFVPVVGGVVAALCGIHNIAIRVTSRYGYCQYWVANTASRSFEVRLYRGGFCT